MPNTNPAKMKNPPQSPTLSGFQPQNHPLDSTKTLFLREGMKLRLAWSHMRQPCLTRGREQDAARLEQIRSAEQQRRRYPAAAGLQAKNGQSSSGSPM